MTCAQPGCTGRSSTATATSAGWRRAAQPVAAPASARASSASVRTIGSATRSRAPRDDRAHDGQRAQPASAPAWSRSPPCPTAIRPTAIMARTPQVAENRRFCARCGEPVGRVRDGPPGRTEGFCRKCGAPFSFEPKLAAGDVVAGQYEVVGCLAHGGMGWVYLARDHNVSDRWVVLKGLLNTGDDDAMAAALAERRFLAEVEHPNIVKIFNFVQHEQLGLHRHGVRRRPEPEGDPAARREAQRRRRRRRCPPRRRSPTCSRSCPRSGYLHRLGLLFCDFKLDNVIQTAGLAEAHRPRRRLPHRRRRRARSTARSATRRPRSPAPGPSVAVGPLHGRAHARAAVHRLPGLPEHVPVHACPPPDGGAAASPSYDSLYRLLLKGTAPDPDDRFQSAEEMADQLVGVLREVVAAEDGHARARGRARCSRGDFRARPDGPTGALLPGAAGRHRRPGGRLPRHARRRRPRRARRAPARGARPTVEVDLRLARALIDAGRLDAADARRSTRSRRTTRGSGGPRWYRGMAELARGRPERRRRQLRRASTARCPASWRRSWRSASAAESAGDPAAARRGGTRSSRAPIPRYTTAAFGLARCCLALGDRAGALAAYDRVARAARAPTPRRRSRRIHCLAAADNGAAGPVADLRRGRRGPARRCTLEGEQRARLDRRAARGGARALEGRRRRAGRRRAPRRPPARSSATCAPGWSATTASSRAWRRPRASASGWSTAPTTFARGRGHDRRTPRALRGVRCAAAAPATASARNAAPACGDAPTEDERVPEGRIELDLGVAAAVSDQGRVHHRNEDAFHLELGRGRGRRRRLRRDLHRRRPATSRRATARAAAGACSPTARARRRGRPRGGDRAAADARRTAAVGARAGGPRAYRRSRCPSCTLVCARLPRRRGRRSAGSATAARTGSRAGDARQLTVDDSWAGEQVAAGLLSAERGGARPARARDHPLGRRRRARTGRPGSSSLAPASARPAHPVHRRRCGTTRPSAADLARACSRRCPPRHAGRRRAAPRRRRAGRAAATTTSRSRSSTSPARRAHHDTLHRRDLPERVPRASAATEVNAIVTVTATAAAPSRPTRRRSAAEIVIVDTSGSMAVPRGKIRAAQAGHRGRHRLHPRRRAVRASSPAPTPRAASTRPAARWPSPPADARGGQGARSPSSRATRRHRDRARG